MFRPAPSPDPRLLQPVPYFLSTSSLCGCLADALSSKPKVTYCPLNLLHAGPAPLRPGRRSVLLTLKTKPQDTAGLAVSPLSVHPPANPTRVCCPHCGQSPPPLAWVATVTSGLVWHFYTCLLPGPGGGGAQSHTPERIFPKRAPCPLNCGPHFPPGAELSGWCQF